MKLRGGLAHAAAAGLLGLALLLAGCAQGGAPRIDAELRAVPVAPGVYLLPGVPGEADRRTLGRIGNAGFIVGPHGVLAIDAGTSTLHGRALLRAIRRTTPLPVRAVLLTQTKPDFLFGALAFREAGIPVLMHREAAALMAARCRVCLERLRRDVGEAAMAGTELFVPDELFDQAHVLDRTGRPAQVLYFGHSSGPGDVAVLDPATGVLFAGGLLDERRIPDLHDADLPGWHGALAALRALPGVRGVVPGHGPPATPAVIDAVESYLSQLEDRVQVLLDEHAPLSEVADRAALPGYAGWDGYPGLHRRNAATLFLRREQEAFGR
ncbi:MBL fold metallo-hydrolase [Aquincola sp. MAHUQ-54]|uniref:MBL fold metallo-hydrolase n=1 Tax=Aquincola agrisoli TaxID=3119538 RepID=A0AAW9PZN3_9BURK